MDYTVPRLGADGKIDISLIPDSVATSDQVTAAVDGAVQRSVVDAKGDLIAGSADNTVVRVPVGANGQVLTADSTATGGLGWTTPAAGGSTGTDLSTVMTTKGDLLVGTGGGAVARIPEPTSSTQYLAYSAGAAGHLAWTTLPSVLSYATCVVYSKYSNLATRPTATNFTNNVFVCDGTNDESEINQAIAYANTQNSNGGRVLLIGGDFTIGSSILMRSGVWLQGQGLGTQIKASKTFTAAPYGMIDVYDQTAHAFKISDMTIDGKNFGVHGININLDGGQVFTVSPSTNPDSANTIDNINIMNCGTATFAGYGLAIRGSNNRAGKYSNIRILGVTGCGVWIDSPDSHYTNIEVGSSGKNGPAYSVDATAPVGHGWYVGGENNMIANCKSWYSRGDGFYMHGTRNSFSNCQAQDNYGSGFNAYYGKNSYASCQADSNGQGLGDAAYGGGTSGFKLTSGSNTLVGCIAFDRGGQTWAQQYGFELSSGFNYSRVTGCITYTNAAGSQTGTVAATSTVDIQADATGK